MKRKTIKYRLTATMLAVVLTVPDLFGNFALPSYKAYAENTFNDEVVGEVREDEDISENDTNENEISDNDADAFGSTSDGLSGTKTSTKDDFNITGSVINYMRKHGSSTSLGNYPYYLVIPKSYTLKEYAFTGNASKCNNEKNASHVADGCSYFSEVYCKTPSDAVLTTLPEGAFYDCTGLITVRQMPERLNKIEKLCFASDTALSTANFCGTELNSIAESAFENDINLSSVLWDGSVSVGKNAFSGCIELKDIGKVKGLGEGSFQYCKMLSHIDLTSTMAIPNKTFLGCTSLTGNMTVGSVGSEAFESCENLQSIKVNGNVGEGAFRYCDNLESADISGTVADGCFDYCKKLNSISFKGDVPQCLCYGLSNLSKVSLTDSVKIGSSAFKSTNVSNIDFANSPSLQEIGDCAFENASLWGGINISEAVTMVGEKAFKSSHLPSVYFGNTGVVIVGSEAFANNSLSELDIHKAKLCSNCFANNPLISVTLGSGITEIGSNAFLTDGTLNNVTITSVPGKIDEKGIFQGSNISNISLGNDINKIQDNLFRNAGFNNVDVSFATDTKLTTIGKNAFKDAKGIKSIILPDTITTIDEGAFDGIEAPSGYNFYVLIKEKSPVESIIKKYNESNNMAITYMILMPDGTVVNPSSSTDDNKENNDENKDDNNKDDKKEDENDESNVSENDVMPEFTGNVFTIKTNYYKDYVNLSIKTDIDEQNRYSQESVNKDENGNIVSRTDIYSVEDENKQAVTYEFSALEGAEITDVYIDSVNKGCISSYTFSDGYDHNICINIKIKSEEGDKELNTFDPFSVSEEYFVDIAYHPEDVSVLGPDSSHILFKNGKYYFVRYYFMTSLDKNIIDKNFIFSEKGSNKITKTYLDGVECESKYSLKLTDEKYHLIVIENENSDEITSVPDIPKDPTPLEPDYRDFDDDGMAIDKTKPKHTISYTLNGGTNSPYNIKYYYEGSVFYFRDAVKDGYDFKGWYNNNSKIISTKNQNKNLKLKALYNPKGYQITYILNGGNFKKPSSVIYSYNIKKTVKLKKPKKTGYKFIGWFYGDIKMTKLRKNDSTKGNITLVAHWAPNDYSIKFDANGGTGKMVKITNCAYNKTITLPANTFKNQGYVFNGWNTKKNGTGAGYKDIDKVKGLKQKGCVRLYAQWVKAK